MKQLKHIISLCLLLCATLSCETVFDIKVTSSSKLFVQCCPGARDTTILQMYATIPVGSKYNGAKFLDSAEIDLRVNGVRETVQFADTLVGTVPEGCWFIPHALNPGDNVELKASSGDLHKISAKTVVPAALPEFKCNVTYETVSVSFNDTCKDDSVYGLGLLVEATIDGPDGYHKVQIQTAKPVSDNSGVWGTSLNNEFVDVSFNGWAFGYFKCGVRLWQKTNGTDEVTLGMKYDDNLFIPIDGDTYTVGFRYKVRLYRFTREFYNYSLALDNIENNQFAHLGIAPATFAYTNVSDGLGIFASWTMNETDWIETQ